MHSCCCRIRIACGATPSTVLPNIRRRRWTRRARPLRRATRGLRRRDGTRPRAHRAHHAEQRAPRLGISTPRPAAGRVQDDDSDHGPPNRNSLNPIYGSDTLFFSRSQSVRPIRLLLITQAAGDLFHAAAEPRRSAGATCAGPAWFDVERGARGGERDESVRATECSGQP